MAYSYSAMAAGNLPTFNLNLPYL